jgi:hypothetical protein
MGEAGRFNRAQQGTYKFDESALWFIVMLVFVSNVYGPLVFVLALLQMYGNTHFATKYKEISQSASLAFSSLWSRNT